MKKKFLVIVFCLSSILFCASIGLTDDDEELECCCQMTCNYVRILGGSSTTIEVDQCWDLDKISSCDEDTACIKVKNVFLTYTNEWSGQGCKVQEKCPISLIYGTDNPRLDVLRIFRDEVLSQTSEGQEMIELYYTWSPYFVEAMEQDEKFKAEMKEMIELVIPIMREREN